MNRPMALISLFQNILTSKFRDPSHTISSSTMLVMMTNTTSLEKQVLMIAQTLEQLMKPMTERELQEMHK